MQGSAKHHGQRSDARGPEGTRPAPPSPRTYRVHPLADLEAGGSAGRHRLQRRGLVGRHVELQHGHVLVGLSAHHARAVGGLVQQSHLDLRRTLQSARVLAEGGVWSRGSKGACPRHHVGRAGHGAAAPRRARSMWPPWHPPAHAHTRAHLDDVEVGHHMACVRTAAHSTAPCRQAGCDRRTAAGDPRQTHKQAHSGKATSTTHGSAPWVSQMNPDPEPAGIFSTSML